MEKFDCCPLIDVNKWDDKTHEWTKKQFVKGYIKAFFNMPCNISSVMTKMDKQIRAVGAMPNDCIYLFDHKTKFKIDVLVEVNKEVPGMENITISGKFYTKVYEGSYTKIGLWKKDFIKTMKENKLHPGKIYMWYTACPKCAKKHGKNYVVFVAEYTKSVVNFVV